MEESKSAFKNFTGKPKRKRSLENPRCRWKDGIRIDLIYTRRGVNTRNLFDSAQDRYYWGMLVNAALNI